MMKNSGNFRYKTAIYDSNVEKTVFSPDTYPFAPGYNHDDRPVKNRSYFFPAHCFMKRNPYTIRSRLIPLFENRVVKYLGEIKKRHIHLKIRLYLILMSVG